MTSPGSVRRRAILAQSVLQLSKTSAEMTFVEGQQPPPGDLFRDLSNVLLRKSPLLHGDQSVPALRFGTGTEGT